MNIAAYGIVIPVFGIYRGKGHAYCDLESYLRITNRSCYKKINVSYAEMLPILEAAVCRLGVVTLVA